MAGGYLKRSARERIGVVTLISAGVVCAGYFNGYNTYSLEFLSSINDFCNEEFVVPEFAASARSVRGESSTDYDCWDGDMAGLTKYNTLVADCVPFWLATESGETGLGYQSYVRWVDRYGNMGRENAATAGIRPVVVLKAGVRTDRTKVDFLGQRCWNIY